METIDKCRILEEFASDFTHGHINREFFTDFIIYNDLGLPLAQSYIYSLIDLKEGGVSLIDETWANLCRVLGVDPDDEYDNFDDLLDIYEDDEDDD